MKMVDEFRKSWKSATRKAGVPEIVAMRLSGHRTRAVFDGCNIVDESDVREALQKVGQYRVTAAKQKVVAMS
jgi:hypothetical protein